MKLEKSPWNEISLSMERVTTYKGFLIDSGNFTLGWTLTCDGPLNYIYKLVLQITERGFFYMFCILHKYGYYIFPGIQH